ncbi:MAG TPA: hypothetical protein PKD70_15570 [Saprospiraceae bacterium]|nr:hypothetical protein [Saprospiraceae bacterium]
MKHFVVMILVLIYHSVLGQNFFNETQIRPVIGTRNYTEGLVGLRSAGPIRINGSVLLGVDVSNKKIPLVLSFHRDWHIDYLPYNEWNAQLGNSIRQTWIENHFFLSYKMKNKISIGLGFYHMKHENIGHHLQSSALRDYKGILISVSKKIDWLNVELRNKISTEPRFGLLLDRDLYSVALTYSFNNWSEEENIKEENNSRFSLNCLLGTRFFSTENLQKLPTEDFDKLGISPTVGIELLDQRSNFSFNIEKDIWISLNGGSPFRELKGHMNSTFIGFKYHLALKNGHHIRTGIGYSMIRDFEKMGLLVTPSPYNLEGLSIYQVKGIGITASYELFKNTDIELKHTLPIRSLDEPLFNPTRFSAGIIYRAHPK